MNVQRFLSKNDYAKFGKDDFCELLLTKTTLIPAGFSGIMPRL